MSAARVLVSGRVQGVGYRAWCREEALRRGLTGTVRNLRDGRVEAVLVGDGAAVDDMLGAMRQGPPGAAVADLAVDDGDGPRVDGFIILSG